MYINILDVFHADHNSVGACLFSFALGNQVHGLFESGLVGEYWPYRMIYLIICSMCTLTILGASLNQTSTFSKNPYGRKREGANTHHEPGVTMAPGVEANGGAEHAVLPSAVVIGPELQATV